MTDKPSRRSELEAWWPLITRIASFSGGMIILFWQTVLEQVDRPYLIGAAVTMLGLPVAGWIADTIKRGGK